MTTLPVMEVSLGFGGRTCSARITSTSAEHASEACGARTRPERLTSRHRDELDISIQDASARS